MVIKILGTGCPNCKKLEKNTKKAIKKAGIEAEIVKVEDVEKIMEYGVMKTPAIVVDDEVKSTGRVLSPDEIEKLIV